MKIPAWLKLFMPATKKDIETILMKLSELSGGLEVIATQLVKAKDEIVAEVKSLQDSLADVELPQASIDSLNRLKVIAQALDDLNPDPAPAPAPAPTPTPEPAPPTP